MRSPKLPAGLLVSALVAGGALPLILANIALAATTVGSPTLTITNATTGATSTTAKPVTNTFTTTTAVAQGGTITIGSGNETDNTNSNDSVALPSTPVADQNDYVVSFTTATNSTATIVSALLDPQSTSTKVILDVGTNVPASATVTVVISGATNPAEQGAVFLTDSTSTDNGTPTPKTNDVNITPPAPSSSSVQAIVTDVNPKVVQAEGETPFTLRSATGTFFADGDSAHDPIVCFVPTSSPSGAATSGVSSSSCGPGNFAVQVNPDEVSATEIQHVNPNLGNTNGAPNESFFVAVYNWNPSANTWQSPSTTSAATEVTSISLADVIPETGVRVADTRSSGILPSGPIGSGKTVGFPESDIEQSLSLPSNIPNTGTATAIAMNVTAVDPNNPGNLQVFSPNTNTCDGQTTSIATVNFQPGQDTSNYTIVKLNDGSSSVICITDNGASVDVVLDVTGFTLASAFNGGGGKRLLDTRPASETGGLIGPLTGGKVYSWPSGLKSGENIAVDVTAVGPTAVGNLRVFPEPSGGPPSASNVPNTAVVNYIPNVDGGSYYITTVGNNGNIDLYSDTSGKVNVVIDLYGTIGSTHVTVLSAPLRVSDSRPGGIGSGQTVAVAASPFAPSGGGTNFIPPNVAAVIGSLSDILPSSVGNLRTFPDGAARPDTASIANYPNQIRENLIIAALNPGNGKFDIYSDGAFTNATFDATAYIS